jgi:hypothetical protein
VLSQTHGIDRELGMLSVAEVGALSAFPPRARRMRNTRPPHQPVTVVYPGRVPVVVHEVWGVFSDARSPVTRYP